MKIEVNLEQYLPKFYVLLTYSSIIPKDKKIPLIAPKSPDYIR